MRKSERERITKFYDDNMHKYLSKEFLEGLLKEDMFDVEENPDLDKGTVLDVNLANEPGLNPDHATVTSENLYEQLKEGIATEEMLYALAEDMIDEGIVPDTMEPEDVLMVIEEALRQRGIEEWPDEMPEVVYRGIWRDPNSGNAFQKNRNGFSKGAFNPEVDGLVGSSNGKFFVTPEPSVAAAYARTQRFDRGPNDIPTNFGDKILKIYTKGLDPKNFCKDKASCVLFGPQYVYNGDIPQEKIKVMGSNGQEYETDRIQWVNYGSDKNIKHIISVINRRF